MNEPSDRDDEALRSALREGLHEAHADDDAALQRRVLAQWRAQVARPAAGIGWCSAGAGLLAGGAARWAGAAMLVLAVGTVAWCGRTDPALGELAHPDVLSQLIFDEV